MPDMRPTRSDYERLERRARRASFLDTGFVFDVAEWGAPEYRSMPAFDRHRSHGFGHGARAPREVSSPALAARLAALLTAGGTAHPLHLDYALRARVEFMRENVDQRDRWAAKAAGARRAYDAAKRGAFAAGTPASRSASYRRAVRAMRDASKYAAIAATFEERARVERALLDPDSDESRVAAAARAEMRDRIRTVRAAREAVPA